MDKGDVFLQRIQLINQQIALSIHQDHNEIARWTILILMILCALLILLLSYKRHIGGISCVLVVALFGTAFLPMITVPLFRSDPKLALISDRQTTCYMLINAIANGGVRQLTSKKVEYIGNSCGNHALQRAIASKKSVLVLADG